MAIRPRANPNNRLKSAVDREAYDRETLVEKKSLAPKKSPRPVANPNNRLDNAAKREAYDRETLTKMASGGKCRGMGAAKKGGSFAKNG